MTAFFARLRRGKSSAACPERCDLISDALLAFLEQADDAYIASHHARRMDAFSRYATGALCNALLDGIFKKPPRMFGTRKYRRRRWRIVQHDPDWVVVHKQLWHLPVKVTGGIYVALGDEMEEWWTIAVREDGFKVVDIRDE